MPDIAIGILSQAVDDLGVPGAPGPHGVARPRGSGIDVRVSEMQPSLCIDGHGVELAALVVAVGRADLPVLSVRGDDAHPDAEVAALRAVVLVIRNTRIVVGIDN